MVESDVAPVVSESVSVIAFVYEPGPTIVAPVASFAVTVTGMSVEVPTGGEAFASAIAIEATTPLSVINTLLSTPGLIVAVV